jgi:hypothetical protein
MVGKPDRSEPRIFGEGWGGVKDYATTQITCVYTVAL